MKYFAIIVLMLKLKLYGTLALAAILYVLIYGIPAYSAERAYSDMTLGQIIETIDGGDIEAQAFLLGTWNGLAWSNSFLDSKSVTTIYCSEETFNGPKVMDLYRKTVKALPRYGQMQAGAATVLMMHRGYPCRAPT